MAAQGFASNAGAQPGATARPGGLLPSTLPPPAAPGAMPLQMGAHGAYATAGPGPDALAWQQQPGLPQQAWPQQALAMAPQQQQQQPWAPGAFNAASQPGQQQQVQPQQSPAASDPFA